MTPAEAHVQARARARALLVVLVAVAELDGWDATPQMLDALASLAAAVVFDLELAEMDEAA